MVKKSWQNRKNKLASMYYCLMILFAIMMLLIMFGVFNTDTVFFWWQT